MVYSQPLKLFYSYSHKDEGLREQLETHLALLSRRGYISAWSDRCISPGREWESTINSHLDESDIILLLISPDFIASDYCYGKELARAIERHEQKESVVIPVILRPVDWSETPFSRLQALPKEGQPVTTWKNLDEAWLDVETGIKKSIVDIHQLKHRSAVTAGLSQMRDLIAQEFKRLETIYSDEKLRSRSCTGIATGILDLDRLLDGLHPSEFVVVAGRPSMGKTDIVVSIAAQAAIQENLSVAFFSMQASAQQIARRVLSATSDVESQLILRGYLRDKDFPKLTVAATRLADAPLYVDDSPRLSIASVVERVKSLKAQNPIRLIILDSLQQLLVTAPPTHFHETAAVLKALAGELHVPVIATCNAARDVEKRMDKRPLISDLGEWNSLEHEADVLLFLYRDEVYNYESPDAGIIEILVAKNRNGPTGTVRALYKPESSAFKDLSYGVGESEDEAEKI